MGNLPHGIALSAVIVVLMQFIRNQSVYPAAHFFADIGAQWISPRGNNALGKVIISKLLQFFVYGGTLYERRIKYPMRKIDITKATDFCPTPRERPVTKRSP